MHPFDTFAVVVHGELGLSSGAETCRFQPGGTFSVPRGTPHAERIAATEPALGRLVARTKLWQGGKQEWSHIQQRSVHWLAGTRFQAVPTLKSGYRYLARTHLC